tara:strand:- start:3155 stop:4303 length:1149 start_codon:yes stop_codon:yes gene_type:complete
MRFFEFYQSKSIPLMEGARIQHAEDIVFWEGSKGATRAIEALKSLEQGRHTDVTVKWDGSPAIIFGRNEQGQFILTDKSGFSAKGYDGKSTSAKDLEQMILNRKTSRGIEPDDSYRQFAGSMRDIFDEYEKAMPKDHIGYFKGDLLYYNTPLLAKGNFTFKPNIVTYTVDAKSPLGMQIAKSKSAVVIHNEIDLNGNESSLQIDPETFFLGTEVLVVPPVTAQEAPQIDDTEIKQLQAIVSKNASAIDVLLNKNTLASLKITDFPNILYSYVNSKVDTGMQNLGNDFLDWLSTSKVSQNKKSKIAEYVGKQQAGFSAIWQIVAGIQNVKDNIINQLETQDAPVKAFIADKPGGEGFVLAHPEGAIKLVDRGGFTAANRAIER